MKWVLLIFIVTGCQAIKMNDYYLPKNFTGEVAVIYEFKNGITSPEKDGRLQLFIPDSGILFIQNNYRYGKVDDQYFIKNDENKFDTLILQPSWFNKNKKSIFFARQKTYYWTNKINQKKNKQYVEFFYVGNKLDSSSEKSRYLFEQKVQGLVESN